MLDTMNTGNIEYVLYKRLRMIAVSFFLMVGVMLLRLMFLQVYKQQELASRGESNFLRFEIMASPRGTIFDCSGEVLATNRPMYDIYWQGYGSKKLDDITRATLKKLFVLLGEEDNFEQALSHVAAAQRLGRRVKLKSDLSFSLLCQISEQLGSSGNLVVVHHFKRVYPHAIFASHVMGYLGNVGDNRQVGRYGLEKVFQSNLEGESGYVLHVTNSRGRRLEQREQKEAKIGSDVRVTLDFKLQRICQKLFAKGQSGTCIVMDPDDGAIKALVSHPTFDPNIFLEPISQNHWNDLFKQNNVFLNRATHALYPPASIFKLVTFAAGLEEGAIDYDTTFTCKGFVRFCGRNYNCIKRGGHGVLSCRDAIAHSCNIHCYEIARRMSIDCLADYATRFGLGSSTSFTLGDKDGLVPTRAWKEATKHESWWKGETLSACIGQSYLLVTPLQIARMIGAICTGRLVRPRILETDICHVQRLALREETLNFLRQSMRTAVLEGSAYKLRRLNDFEIFAKTGTAQTASLRLSKGSKKHLEHGWFGSYFSYRGGRPLVLIVLVEHTGTSLPALLLARKFLVNCERLYRANGVAR